MVQNWFSQPFHIPVRKKTKKRPRAHAGAVQGDASVSEERLRKERRASGRRMRRNASRLLARGLSKWGQTVMAAAAIPIP